MTRPTRTKAIKKYCLECGGFVNANAVLCHITDCPLWPYRIGEEQGSNAYEARIRSVWNDNKVVRAELEHDGFTLQDMLGSRRLAPRPRRIPPRQVKQPKVGVGGGGRPS